MNKKQERIITIGIAGFLIAYLCYQIAYGLSLTQVATNASYKYGFNQSKSEWSSCSDPDGDCQTGLTDCSGPVSYSVYNYTTGYYNAVPNSAPLSNHTACIDGYVNGWNHVCDHKIARSWPNLIPSLGFTILILFA